MTLDPYTIALTLLGVFLISYAKGAFGGGFAIIGIPLLALAMDPLTAGAILAILFLVMDAYALRYWKPTTWSKPDIKVLIPAVLLGTLIGAYLLDTLDDRAVRIIMALITLTFVALWFSRGGQPDPKPRSTPLAWIAGTISGVTSTVAHAGGPPLALYLLRLGMPKLLYAGTTSLVFTFANVAKALPWLWIAAPPREAYILMVIALPTIPLGVWLGWRTHDKLDQTQLYRVCYALLTVVAAKLLWDGVSGYL